MFQEIFCAVASSLGKEWHTTESASAYIRRSKAKHSRRRNRLRSETNGWACLGSPWKFFNEAILAMIGQPTPLAKQAKMTKYPPARLKLR